MHLPVIGDVLAGKYRLDEVLGEGGFGCVYRGTTELSNRSVAIKVLKPGRDGYDQKRAARFKRELRAIAKLQSPYTLTLFDYGETDAGLLFMVTEFIDGHDLNEVLAQRGTLSERETAHVLMQLLLSLDEAHQAGILHRDLKPSNIRVFEYQDDELRVKLLDFGLARSLTTDEARLTGTGKVIGTPRYMSPEQLTGQELSSSSDIYSLGLVASECVAGRSASLAQGGSRLIDESTSLSPAFRGIVNGMLASDPGDRPATRAVYEALRASRTAFAGDKPATQLPLEEVADTTTAVRKPKTIVEPLDPGPAAPRAHRRQIGVALVLALIVVVGILAVAVRTDAPPAPDVARVSAAVAPASSIPEQQRPTTAAQVLPRAGAGEDPPVGCAAWPARGYNVLSVEEGPLDEPRKVHVYIPRGYAPGSPHALLVAFHDDLLPPHSIVERSKLKALADRNAVVVYIADMTAQAVLDPSPRVNTSHVIADVREVEASLCIDPKRIFAYGHGGGGRAVHSFRCDFPQLAASAATSHRFDEGPPCDVLAAIPHLSIATLGDLTAPIQGGRGCGRYANQVMSLDAHEAELRSTGDCSKESKTVLEHHHGDCRVWECESAARMTCRVDGGREFWGTRPRQGFTRDPKCAGVPVDFPYTDVIWRFFDEVAPGAPAAGGEE